MEQLHKSRQEMATGAMAKTTLQKKHICRKWLQQMQGAVRVEVLWK
jgi:hypothetical protein